MWRLRCAELSNVPEPFGPGYAALYDSLYAAKDYAGECRLIQRLFAEYGSFPIRSVLDLGCGSGSHAAGLAKLGYGVTGVDRSAAMLAEAARKCVRLIQSDLKELDLGETFDAALMMFAVLGYQLADNDVAAALRAAHRHLRPGGLLLFDCWYGPAVLAQKPSDRVITVGTSGSPITRKSTGMLDEARHVCEVEFRIDPDISEHHTVRYFFADEIRQFLSDARFELLRLGAFPEFDHDPGPDTWNVSAVARA